MQEWWMGLGASGVISLLAFWRKSLSLSGAIAAIIVGTLLYTAGTPAWYMSLIAFFLASSLLSSWKRRQKSEAEKAYEKSGRRDAGQVIANGGLASLLCLGHLIIPSPLWLVAFTGIIASVTADTWATEIGGLSRRQPRSLFTWRVVPPGTSGGVSTLGFLASAAGGLFIGLVVAVSASSYVILIPICLIAGFVGALSDSILGAKLQRMNRCSQCHRSVEASRHCNQPTLYSHGLRWMNNDAVNLLSSLIGGIVSLGLYILFQ